MFCKECLFRRQHAVSGQGFTKYECKKCGQLGYWHTTNTPKYCSFCSDKNLICADCGKDMIVEMIENLKGEMSLYDIALEIGISESSLYKYINTGKIGTRVYKRLKEFTEEYYEEKGDSYGC